MTIRFRRSSNYKLLIERNELQSLSLMMNAGFHSSEPRNLETEIRMLNAIEQIARVQLSGKDVQRLNQDIVASFPILKIAALLGDQNESAYRAERIRLQII